MTSLAVRRIANMLEAEFGPLIDMSDWAGRPDADTKAAFLSRALAALCIRGIARTLPEVAAASITDGYGDNGIDAIYFDTVQDALILVQSKWSSGGGSPIDAKGMNAFVNGIDDLINAKFRKFNEKVQRKEAEIRSALYAPRTVKLQFVTAHVSAQPTAPFVKSKAERIVDSYNDPIPVSSYLDYGVKDIYNLITSEAADTNIELQIPLAGWGAVEQPFLAFYGYARADALGAIWDKHRSALFSKNLRSYYPNSEINAALERTLSNDPEHFWYFNNGITIICDKVSKMLVGGDDRRGGIFTCENASIVNGAQTVGTIGIFNQRSIAASGQEEGRAVPFVHVKIISLEKCPPDFSQLITRAANLQNAVGYREFAAMDPHQRRLAMEFALDRRTYAFKQGEPEPTGDSGCGIVELTQALACADSANLATSAKREISSLWTDTSAEPYIRLFNDKLTSSKAWKCVIILRAVESELHKIRQGPDLVAGNFSAENIAVHLNRIIAHIVFQSEPLKHNIRNNMDDIQLSEMARAETRIAFPKITKYLEENHTGEYLGRFCKNFTKCETLATFILSGVRQAALLQESFDFSAVDADHE